MDKKDESAFLNMLKGAAVFLMIWGHCIQYCALDAFDFFENIVFRFIYSFHMPLFMLISGYLFFYSEQKRDLKSLLIHRTQSMLQPIVFAGILNALLQRIPAVIMGDAVSFTNGALLGNLYSLWFLWTVLSSGIAVALAVKLTGNRFLQGLFLVLGMGFVALFHDADMHMFMYPYFVAGYLCGRNRARVEKIFRRIKWIVCVLFFVMLPFYEYRHYIYNTPIISGELGLPESLWIDLFRWLIGFCGSVFLAVFLGKVLDSRAKVWKNPIVKGLAALGANSLPIYCVSVSLLSCWLPVGYGWVTDRFLGRNLLAENIWIYNLVFTPLLAMAYAWGLYWVVSVLKKTKVHSVLFGR